MIFLQPLREARELLRVDAAAARDAPALKRAYREAVRRAPPDRDPEGFARARKAYELLSNPTAALAERLRYDAPLVSPPRLPSDPRTTDVGKAALCLLRWLVTRVPVGELVVGVPALEAVDASAEDNE